MASNIRDSRFSSARYDEYNMLMSSMHVSVSKHLLDPDFTVIWANDFYYEKTGYTKEEYEALFHNHVSEYFRDSPESYEEIGKVIVAALERGDRTYELVCRMPVKDGNQMWIKVMGTFTDETINGVPVIYCVFTDITDVMRARAEQTVTYDNLPGFVAKFRVREGRAPECFELVDANDRFVRFFGKTTGDKGTYSLVNLDTEQNRRALDTHYPDMRRGSPVHFTVQAKNARGEDAWLQINADCVDSVQGDPVYLVIYIDITDITEQRELQKKLEERSKMLRSALGAAERANRAKSDFLSRMSHDIRTPMNAILGMLTIARESREDPERVWDCLDKVENSAKFLLTLINDILDMSKIESGKAVIKKKPFDFGAFLKNTAAMFYGQAEKKKISFQVSVGRNLDETYVGDELKLSQIVINLLGNAIKFTEPGGSILLSVAAGKRTGKAVELVFTVRDNGIGMERAFLKKIFKPFEQDLLQRTNQGGSGLGLAIAENYARLMNGGIDVDSEPGKGSTFVLRVWLDTAEPGEPVTLKESFRHVSALVVHSDREEREYIRALLARFGVVSAGASSADRALELLDEAEKRNEPYTVVLVDWWSHQIATRSLIRNMRRRFGRCRPRIVVAAYDWSAIRADALEAGADGFMQKPLLGSTLYDSLVSLAQDNPLTEETKREDRFNGERVLLVEDNELNQEIAVTLLTSRNLRVDTARDGREAVEMFRRCGPGHYLAILMDIQMPVMDGLEATRLIRSLPREDAGTVPIVAMSANAFEDDIEKSLEAGMNAHVSKPVDICALLALLRNIQKGESHVTLKTKFSV